MYHAAILGPASIASRAEGDETGFILGAVRPAHQPAFDGQAVLEAVFGAASAAVLAADEASGFLIWV
jgi:hypothetical protein